MDHFPDCQLELVSQSPHRRVWAATGSIQGSVEWVLDHDGWGRVFGSERILVNGFVVWKDFALTHGFVGWLDFPAPSSDGLTYLRLERVLHRRHLTALRVSVERIPIYEEGALELLPAPPPGLPIPAPPPHADPRDLPRPAMPASDGWRLQHPSATGFTAARRKHLKALAPVLALLVVVAIPVAAVFQQFRQVKGDWALVAAASDGDAARVRAHLQRGSSANASHREGSSALWWAVAANSPETVEALLDHGADPNSSGQWSSVLEQAIQNLDHDDTLKGTAIARLLLQRRALITDKPQVELLEDALAAKLRKLSGPSPYVW
ncbi:MAG: ankyrin repeat domain-containing protein [Actinomycetota bacterium]